MIQKNPQRVATIEDLYAVRGKAELVHGEIVHMAPTGGLPGYAAGEIFVQLREYARRTRRGFAIGDNVGFEVDLPHRKSFCPDAAFVEGKLTMKFVAGAPLFAVEVRSDHDYGAAAERAIREKRTDYFAAGTQAVWDVDLYNDVIVRLFLATAPDSSIDFRRGDMAHAEPVLPGWSMPIGQMFPESDDELAAD